MSLCMTTKGRIHFLNGEHLKGEDETETMVSDLF